MKANPRFRLLPMPGHSLVLWLVWLMLNDFSAGHIVLGAILAFFIPLFAAILSTPQPSIIKPLVAVRYIGTVIYDIVVSNIIVAMQVLGPSRKLNSGFVAIPLELTGELPLTVLASTISLTPGTVSVDFSEDLKWLYVHALHIEDEQDTIDSIKQRYERPLKEMFGC